MVNEYLMAAQKSLLSIRANLPTRFLLDKMQKLQGILNLNADVQYLNALIRFQMMLMDVTNTIQDVVKEAMGEK